MKSNDKTINRKFINIEHRSKKSQIEKEIQDFEDKKSEKIMELGISAYEKIRRGLIDESIFGELTYEIKKLDLEIYNRMLDIANIDLFTRFPGSCRFWGFFFYRFFCFQALNLRVDKCS